MTPSAGDDRAATDSLGDRSCDLRFDPAIVYGRTPGSRAARWLQRTPSWLISLCLHLMALIVLALVSAGAKPLVQLRVLLAQRQDIPESELCSVELIDPLQTATQSPAHPGEASANDDEAPSYSPEVAMISAFGPPGATTDAFERRAMSRQELDVEVASSDTPAGAGARFYGIEAEGNSFVFIVDRSNSMRGEKLQEAKNELMYAVRRLSAEQKFYVIFFAGWSEFMRFDPHGVPAPFPVNATIENIVKLAAWVDWIQVEPWTNPFDGVKFAMELAPDAVFLLTDGEFTDNGGTMRFLRSQKSAKATGGANSKVAFHCIAFHSRAGEPALRKIAEQFGGTYRYVPPQKFAARA